MRKVEKAYKTIFSNSEVIYIRLKMLCFLPKLTEFKVSIVTVQDIIHTITLFVKRARNMGCAYRVLTRIW